MDRRKFVASSAAVACAAVMGKAFANQHEGHKHHHGKSKLTNALSKTDKKKLVESTADCLKTGQVCLSHCTQMFAAGDTTMAICHAKVLNALASCEALNKIAHQNNIGKKALKAFIQGCRDICQECHDECEKHAKMHDECKDCMKSCKECIEVCDSIIS